MFVDFAKIYVKAGDGGKGAVSFHRERFVPFGGPDGGDGGRGGSVSFVADGGMQTLVNFKFRKKFVAENGFDGGKNNKFGKNGKDLLIKVPKGTFVYDSSNDRLLAEICSSEKPVVVACGGLGGFGNARFKNSVRQSPRFAKPGKLGQEFELNLELKLLADVGLIGFPNVGKSTLISVISNAKPKIGDYAFTTLNPVLGVVMVQDFSYVVADIPGLIKGASDGVGLGFRFLKHIQKCRILVHVVDVSVTSETKAEFDLKTINSELKKFDKNLLTKQSVIVANKVDCVNSKKLTELKRIAFERRLPFFEVSAASSKGILHLKQSLCEILQKIPEEKPVEVRPVFEMKQESVEFEVTKKKDVFYVYCPYLARIMQVSDVDCFENLQYFQENSTKKSTLN